ncbi:AMP-binding enzyme family protein (macronuclear) [Tetrahymena thermophila SB210]|uniref:AMP-binding enzyme family protein n=1 Tax=Tetrahymena thermophila (strain SB210) TaxID=312017 RepID=W7X8W4_TETTS|nr:AMP-binding enzyme family protein [Tetrahymena thermophila SB210]EWS75810.1 AMP-binding enzyme family protein [Tetrahymena thermophila SB210]|eukprot:XP_012651732.1 AMP-binding enzyme family protein [Tetrahymena thermophila SB210]
MLLLKKIDIFSTEFSFYVENELTRKRTFFGICLTHITIIIGIAYLIYLSILYKNNQIDPKFRSQTFVSEDQIDVNLSQDLVGFRFEYLPNKYIEQVQQQQNKTYIVYMPVLFYQNLEDFYYYPLNITNCTNPDLDGYNCLDFSQLQNFTLTISTRLNFNTQIFILVYGCLDIDSVKTTIPNNCASQKEIDDLVNNQNTNLRLKLLTSQYNITSQKFQINYKNQLIFTSANLFIQTKLKAQKQSTIIKEGFLIQSESTYAAPINYDTFTQQFDRAYANLTSGVGPYIQVSLAVDELQIMTNIEFPIYPEVLSLVNSIVTLMMGIGCIARYFSQRLLKQQFFLLFLQNLFQETYEKLLKFNKMLPDNEEVCFIKSQQCNDDVAVEFGNHTSNQQINVPSLMVKSKLQFMDSPRTQMSPILTKTNEINLNEFQDLLLEDTKSRESKAIQIDRNDLASSREQSKKEMRLSQQGEHFKIASPKDSSNQLKQKNIPQIQNHQLSQQLRQLNLKINKRYASKIKKSTMTIDEFSQKQARLCQTQKSEIEKISEIFSQKLKSIFSEENLKIIQSKMFGRLKKSSQGKYDCKIDQHIQKDVECQINKCLDIFQLYKDIIFLKKAVMILLTKDQLATLQIVGFSPKTFVQKDNQENETSNLKDLKKKNYFQEQIEILESKELQSQYIKKFFSKFQVGKLISETDYRILASIMNYEQ